jgi:hypothetical protein
VRDSPDLATPRMILEPLFTEASCLACRREVVTLAIPCRPGFDPIAFDAVGVRRGRVQIATHPCHAGRLEEYAAIDWLGLADDGEGGW